MLGLSYSNPRTLPFKSSKRAIEDSFVDPETDMVVLFNQALNIGLNRHLKMYWAIEQFVERFPRAAQPAMVCLAERYHQEGLVDLAAALSRQFLRNSAEAGILGEPNVSPLFQKAFRQALDLLAEVYIKAGALSYAIRIFELGSEACPDAMCYFDRRTQQLQDELENDNASSLDGMWETFLIGGAHFAKLMSMIEAKGFTGLSQRCHVLYSRLQTESDFVIDHREILMSLAQIERHQG